MSNQELLKTLRELRFLHDIEDQYLEEIADVAKIVDFHEDQVIFREGEPTAHLFLIVDGKVSIDFCSPGRGRQQILTVGTGELLGWSPLLEQTRSTATARAIVPTQAVAINAGQMLTLCEHNSRLGYEFMRNTALALSQRLSATRLQLLDVYASETPTITWESGE